MHVLQGELDLGPDLWHAGAGFGGGIGRCGDVCGAVVGAVIALGVAEGRRGDSDSKVSDRVRGRVQALYDGFVAAFGSVDCSTLSGYRLREPEQLQVYKSDGATRARCAEYVKFAIRKALD